MKTMIFSIAAGLVFAQLIAPPHALANPFQDGQNAYDSGDYATALRLWTSLAEGGDPKAQNALGDMYITRRARLTQNNSDNNVEAAKWYRKAAEQGFAPAQANLGRLYYLGIGVARNLVEAASWRRKAAEQGYPEAQVWLGNNYRDGEGVPKDYVLAYMWFNLAAASPIGVGFDAPKSRDRLAARMTPDQIAEAQRLTDVQAEAIRQHLRSPTTPQLRLRRDLTQDS
jgi:hypothetical protein